MTEEKFSELQNIKEEIIFCEKILSESDIDIIDAVETLINFEFLSLKERIFEAIKKYKQELEEKFSNM